MFYAFVITLAAVSASGAYALYQLLCLGERQTHRMRADAAATMLFTLSALWMIVHLVVDPAVMQADSDGITRLSYEVFGLARNAGMFWFHVNAGREAAKQREKQQYRGGYGDGRTVARSSSPGRVDRGHQLPR